LGAYYSGKDYERCTLPVKLVNLAKSGETLYAVLQAGGVTFTVSHKRCATYDPQTLANLGIPPQSFNIIGIKAGYLSPEYQAMSKQSILALTQGDTALDLRSLPYVKTPRPMYPLDLDMTF
jgi:microcystin degradation protein MlrC